MLMTWAGAVVVEGRSSRSWTRPGGQGHARSCALSAASRGDRPNNICPAETASAHCCQVADVDLMLMKAVRQQQRGNLFLYVHALVAWFCTCMLEMFVHACELEYHECPQLACTDLVWTLAC